MLFEFDELSKQRAKIKVLGVGGGGGNAVNRMIESKLNGVEFIAINTDAQDLEDSQATTKIQIGLEKTKGLGAGTKTETGKSAVEENLQNIENMVNDTDMVFITAGMGGGTGTGASPTIAKIAKAKGCLTVGIVTKPFEFEGPMRMKRAEQGVEELRKYVDTLIVIPNQQLLQIADRSTTMSSAFKTADSILYQATKGISDLISNHGVMNLDFADVYTTMKDRGDAIIGTGIANGEERAILAAQQAISSPLLNDMSITGAKSLLINITGNKDLNLMEVDEACHIITEEAGRDADIIVGTIEEESMNDEIMITVIATGFDQNENPAEIKDEDIKESKKPDVSMHPMGVPFNPLMGKNRTGKNDTILYDSKNKYTKPVNERETHRTKDVIGEKMDFNSAEKKKRTASPKSRKLEFGHRINPKEQKSRQMELPAFLRKKIITE